MAPLNPTIIPYHGLSKTFWKDMKIWKHFPGPRLQMLPRYWIHMFVLGLTFGAVMHSKSCPRDTIPTWTFPGHLRLRSLQYRESTPAQELRVYPFIEFCQFYHLRSQYWTLYHPQLNIMENLTRLQFITRDRFASSVVRVAVETYKIITVNGEAKCLERSSISQSWRVWRILEFWTRRTVQMDYTRTWQRRKL